MKTIIKNEEAQAGVGTLIIFIAMVLVAAVAAAVLIQTSGVMQSKSTTTTKEAAASISENIVIDSVDGDSDSGSNLTTANVTIRVSPGGSDIDINKLTLKIKTKTYNLGGAGNTFLVCPLRDPEATLGTAVGSCGSTTPSILKPGAIVKLYANSLTGLSDLSTRKEVIFSLIPEKGTTVNLPITLPTIGASKVGITLYP